MDALEVGINISDYNVMVVNYRHRPPLVERGAGMGNPAPDPVARSEGPVTWHPHERVLVVQPSYGEIFGALGAFAIKGARLQRNWQVLVKRGIASTEVKHDKLLLRSGQDPSPQAQGRLKSV